MRRLRILVEEQKVRRVATYERVSSEDQRERETIKTQTDELARHLERQDHVRFVGRYQDDGVSGVIPLRERPAGRILFTDAAAGKIDEVWVLRLDRLGRDDIDPLIARQDLELLGVSVKSLVEGDLDPFMFAIHVAVAAQERRSFLDRSMRGMDRAVHEGRYTGGIVAFGYRVEGEKRNAQWVPDETPFWSDRSSADIVRMIYRWLEEGWSCPRIAAELDQLGVPTAASRSGRGTRVKATQARWRAGRIRNMVVNTVYRGEYRYGKRATRRKEIIVGQVPPLVSEELWQAAQDTLARNRIAAKNTRRIYLLRTVMRCGRCDLTYVGTTSRGKTWYRCNGKFIERGSIDGRCPNRGLDGSRVEPLIWADIEQVLLNPGELLAEIADEEKDDTPHALAEAERVTLGRRLVELTAQENNAIDLNVRALITLDRLQSHFDRIRTEQDAVKGRLADLAPAEVEATPVLEPDLANRLREQLAGGLTDQQRQEIVRLFGSADYGAHRGEREWPLRPARRGIPLRAAD